MTKLLLVGAGASFSTMDVEVGYLDAFKAMPDVTVLSYALDKRIGMSQQWANTVWRGRGKPADGRPEWPDIIHKASSDALEMALEFRVDWVVVISGMYFSLNTLELMRRAGIRTALIGTESPYDDPQVANMAKLVNVCWTNERTSVPFLRRFNPNTYYLRAAYDPVRHTPVAEANTEVPRHDVVFVGSGFQERIDLLSAVDWTGIDLGLYGVWSLLPSRHRLRKYIKGGYLDNAQTVALYRAAKIGLNLHRTSREYSTKPTHVAHAESMNPRGYELAACGVFQISDYRAELPEVLGRSVVTSQNHDDLQKYVRYFLQSPNERTDKSLRARQAVGPHTFAARAAQVLADLETYEQPIAKGA